jgi:hypothetical protein
MDITRRQAFLGLTAIAAPFVIRTPGILMPVIYRELRFRARRPPIEEVPYLEFAPAYKEMVARMGREGLRPFRWVPLECRIVYRRRPANSA